jgi:hypothetical protein
VGLHVQRHHVARTTHRERRLVPKQSAFEFWPKVARPRQVVITAKMINRLFQERLLYADLLKRSSDPKVAHAAQMAVFTMEGIRKDLLNLMKGEGK